MEREVLFMFAAVFFLLFYLAWMKIVAYLYTPFHVRRVLRMQGLYGPPPRFLLGNMNEVVRMKDEAFEKEMDTGNHDLVPRICPYYTKWSRRYGRTFVFWWGIEPRITVTEPEMIKEILCTRAAHFGKSPLQQKGGALLLGNGLIMANGKEWAHRRQIVCQAFKTDKIKAMVPSMVESTRQLTNKWDNLISLSETQEVRVDVFRDLAVVTSDIIARTAFGSSYSEGMKLFHMLRAIQKLFVESNKYLWLPGSKLLPTGVNKRIHSLKREMQASLEELVKLRKKVGDYGTDLLGLMLQASRDSSRFRTEELIEECQTFFFVGHETTLMLVTWTLMLLSLHPEWQSRCRDEVARVFKNNKSPDADMLSRLKTVGMVLNEALRLYPPAPNLVRYALRDTKVGDIHVPRGAAFWIPILVLHHDTYTWGQDAHIFRPERFQESCHLNTTMSFLPFSFGPRVCVGQLFAIMEAKLILAMVLQRYHVRLSPDYRHAPVTSVTLRPKYGMPLIISPVEKHT